MEYRKAIELKDGRTCVLRNCTEADAATVVDNYVLTHLQTDYLLAYPDEIHMTVEKEAQFLKSRKESPNEIELLAETGDKLIGLAGFWAIGAREKVRHRAELGISIDQNYWGIGVGRAMLNACIECARSVGYAQLELEVVGDNERAIALYQSEGFTEFGRNPKGFRSRRTGWQELVSMRLELTDSEE